ncbi:ABC transporter ATP-binding protein [Ferrovibrio xuzhouensis]|uniref:ABC transporter ATP-binding protein n=1 Tax=Ferrovibrio xuzhouensis TaxID=1576914 RepID=A0ABV7VMI7_9PROT
MRIDMRGIAKRFGAVQALDGVDLEIPPGEVLALLGENGAGKSTLMKLLLGIYGPDSGEIQIDGTPTAIRDPKHAVSCGIGMVFQNFSLFPALSVRDNLRLAKPGLGWWLQRRDVDAALDHLTALAPGIEPSRPVYSLTVGECQMVELAKVLSSGASTVILDEPTSVLLPPEVERLYGFIRDLKASGRSVVLISHKLADVSAVADRIVVMRRGKVVDRARVDERTVEELVEGMVGTADTGQLDELPAPADIPLLQVRSLQAPGLKAVDFEVYRGEVLGIAGVSGNGQKALADALAGVLPVTHGDIVLDGISIARAADGMPDARVAYLPEAPRQNAVAEGLSNSLNLLLRRLPYLPRLPRWGTETANARTLLETFDVRPPVPEMATGQLSGGNLQKLVIARELSGQPDLVVACYPTMGLDVAACHAVYTALFAHARRGAAVVWFSEDLDDLQKYAHRIAVMNSGSLAGILNRSEATRQRLGELMATQHRNAA